jgi:hypothetical protein
MAIDSRLSTVLGVLLTLGCIAATGVGCLKPVSALSGGKGGKAVLVVTPIHDTLDVDSCVIYIKYAANNAPADNVYDDSLKCTLNNNVPQSVFTGLQNGQYYIYANGYHLAYNTWVKGGIPITITVQDTNVRLLPTFAYYK